MTGIFFEGFYEEGGRSKAAQESGFGNGFAVLQTVDGSLTAVATEIFDDGLAGVLIKAAA